MQAGPLPPSFPHLLGIVCKAGPFSMSIFASQLPPVERYGTMASEWEWRGWGGEEGNICPMGGGGRMALKSFTKGAKNPWTGPGAVSDRVVFRLVTLSSVECH